MSVHEAEETERLRLAVQSKGRLHDATLSLLAEAGVAINCSHGQLLERSSSFPVEVLFLRDDDIPQCVACGAADVGIVGENVYYEAGLAATVVERLGLSCCRLSLAVPVSADYADLSWFEGKRIATSYPTLLRQFLAAHSLSGTICSITGSVEVAPQIGLCDAICDIVATGSTLVHNGLREVATVLTSEAIVIATPSLSAAASSLLSALLFRLRAVRAARGKKYVLMNVPRQQVDAILAVLPATKSPTVLPLATAGWCSIHTVVAEASLWTIINDVKALGAQDILVVPIEKMIS